jgi:multicomponent K+:H+ antiporter subunit F/multicomponent Na+:H+ antiporter subunit F
MSEWLTVLVNLALLVMVSLLPFAFYRAAKRGQNAADRLVGVDMITNLLVGIVVLLALVEQTSTPIDIAIVIAALSLAGTTSIARFIAEGRVF